ncbi:MAG: P-loop NTPase [bacterium]|nr:P-loop NTPase [bacterium]
MRISIIDDGTLGIEEQAFRSGQVDAEITVYHNPDGVKQSAGSDLVVASVSDAEKALKSGESGQGRLIAYGRPDDLERALMLGAVDFLPQPVDTADLLYALKKSIILSSSGRDAAPNFQSSGSEQVAESSAVTVYSPSGGIGKTMLAVNLAVALAKQFGQKVVLVDLNLQFPGVDLMLNLSPARTVIDLLSQIDHLDSEFLESFLMRHSSGIRVLPSSQRPEDSERVSDKDVRSIIGALKKNGYLTVIDSSSNLNDNMLAAFDCSNNILLMTSLELLALRNTRTCLEIMASLGYDKSKIELVLNRATSKDLGVQVEDAENLLGERFMARIPSSGECVVKAANHGQPFVITQPESEISKSVAGIARILLSGEDKQPVNERKRAPLFGKAWRLFGA